MGKMGRKLMWALAGTAASKVMRNTARSALHRRDGMPRLPRRVRKERGFGTALGFALLTGAVMALGDVLSEQGKTAAKAR
ncbi:MAG TPA: hypothetical protein VFQ45_02325 [Longimicrobium sp.]|nr:hypothetical protein [Longimicrobium sp.]